jgi:dienelactone hydrolase
MVRKFRLVVMITVGMTLLTWGTNGQFAVSQTVPGAPKVDRLPGHNLLVHRGPNGGPTESRTLEDWLKRRREIVKGMHTVMGSLPGPEKRCDLDWRVEDEVDCGSHVRRSITYASEPNCRVPAFLLIPKSVLSEDGKPAAAVLALHPTDDRVANGVVVGLGKTNYPPYASELAERGYVVLAPNYPWLGEYRPDLKALGWESGTLKAVWDNIRGLDLLDSLPFVAHGKYGVIGHSLGGHNAVFTSVLDERLKVTVTSCELDSFVDYYGGNEAVWQPEKGWTQTRYMPKLAGYRGRLDRIPFDFPELIGALAPRSVLIIAPLKDDNFRAASVDRIVQAAKPVFQLYGQEQNLRVEHPNCPHDFPEAMRELAYKQLDAELR